MSEFQHLALLLAGWIVYAIIHSVLASDAVKQAVRRRFPGRYRAYRLLYNLQSLVLLAPLVWLLFSYPGEPLWRWPAPLAWLADALAVLAIAGFFWSLRYYDGREFLGTRQMGDVGLQSLDQAPLTLSPLHRWVRHPWYFLGLVVIWTREMDTALLLTAVVLTLYLVVGSRLEEAKLIAAYGNAYKRYRDKVPGLLPRPWKHLSGEDVASILRESRVGTPR